MNKGKTLTKTPKEDRLYHGEQAYLQKKHNKMDYTEYAKHTDFTSDQIISWAAQHKKKLHGKSEKQEDFEEAVLSAVKKPVKQLNFSVTLSYCGEVNSYDVQETSGASWDTLKELAVKKMLDDIEVTSVVLI